MDNVKHDTMNNKKDYLSDGVCHNCGYDLVAIIGTVFSKCLNCKIEFGRYVRR